MGLLLFKIMVACFGRAPARRSTLSAASVAWSVGVWHDRLNSLDELMQPYADNTSITWPQHGGNSARLSYMV